MISFLFLVCYYAHVVPELIVLKLYHIQKKYRGRNINLQGSEEHALDISETMFPSDKINHWAVMTFKFHILG